MAADLEHLLAEPAPFDLPSTAQVAVRIEQWRLAYPEFALLIEGHGDTVQALRSFATLCKVNHRYDLAIEVLQAMLAGASEDPALWRELASTCQVTERDAYAEKCTLRSLSIDPHHAVTWLQYASLAYKLQHIDQSEAAYLRALSLDPDLGDAKLGLGVLYLGTRKFDDAIVYLRRALAWGGADRITQLCLGQALYMAGRFGECADAFDAASTFSPLDGVPLRLHARARTFDKMLNGDIASAMAHYPALARHEAEPLDDILRAAFALFSAYGMRDSAVAVGRFRLTSEPDDQVQLYLLDAVAGTRHDRAPATYVETHFDEFAEGFDQKLVEVLGYRVPQDLAELVATCQSSFASILDLGCGTGLAAEPLQRFGAHLAGVDLSDNMLAIAGRRGAYGALAKADVMDYLATKRGAFDLIFAADLLIYIGRIDALVERVAQALPPGGLFAASIETTDDADFTLLPSGRFAQSPAYFEAMTSSFFDIARKKESHLRIEAGKPVAGLLYVLRRRT